MSTHDGRIRRVGHTTATSLSRLGCGALLLGALLSSCSNTVNRDFCDEETPCASSGRCVANECFPEFDAGDDIAPACPEASHECVPAAPDGWNGPASRAELGKGDVVPVCADVIQGGLTAGIEFDETASCECSCTTATQVNCSEAVIEAREDSGLSCRMGQCAPGTCPQQDIPQSDCTIMNNNVRGGLNLRVYPGAIISGSCEPPTTIEEFSAVEFTANIGLCALETSSDGCDSDSLCAPLPETDFAAERCIYQEGEHECPVESPYSERVLSFQGLADTRECAGCSCGLPQAGTKCGGTVSECAGATPENEQGVGCAASSTWNGIAGLNYTPDPSAVSCVPSAEAPNVDGALVGAAPVTICCELAP